MEDNFFIENLYRKAINERVIEIDGIIDEKLGSLVCSLIELIAEMDGDTAPKPIILKIHSSGGSVWEGNRIIGTMNFYKKNAGYTFTGVVTGIAFSMAFDILCNCDQRYGYKYSEYMLHQSQVGIPPNSLVKSDSLIEYYKKQWEKSVEYYIKDTKLTKKELKKLYENDKELWLLSEEALKLNIIQKII